MMVVGGRKCIHSFVPTGEFCWKRACHVKYIYELYKYATAILSSATQLKKIVPFVPFSEHLINILRLYIITG